MLNKKVLWHILLQNSFYNILFLIHQLLLEVLKIIEASDNLLV